MDRDLCDAIERAERGLIDANLGGGVIKQRIARPGKGRSGGFRSIVLFRSRERAFFVYGFPKNARDNISEGELKAFKELATVFASYTDAELKIAIDKTVLTEVNCHD